MKIYLGAPTINFYTTVIKYERLLRIKIENYNFFFYKVGRWVPDFGISSILRERFMKENWKEIPESSINLSKETVIEVKAYKKSKCICPICEEGRQFNKKIKDIYGKEEPLWYR